MRNQKKNGLPFLDDIFSSGSEFVIPGVVVFIPYVKQPMRVFPRETTNPLRRKHKNEILSHRFMVLPSKTYLLKTSLPKKNKIITHHVSLINSSILFRKKYVLCSGIFHAIFFPHRSAETTNIQVAKCVPCNSSRCSRTSPQRRVSATKRQKDFCSSFLNGDFPASHVSFRGCNTARKIIQTTLE